MRSRAPRPARCAATAVLAATLLVSGCGAGGTTAKDAPQVGTDDSASPTEPADGQDPDPEALPSAVPEVGLELTYSETAAERERAAMAAYATFEQAVRGTLRTARLDPRLPDVAAGPVVDDFRDTVRYLRSNDLRFEGTARADVDVEDAREQFVVLSVCLDGTDVRQVQAGEPRRLDGRERGLVRALVFQSPDRSWVVNEYRELDRPC